MIQLAVQNARGKFSTPKCQNSKIFLTGRYTCLSFIFEGEKFSKLLSHGFRNKFLKFKKNSRNMFSFTEEYIYYVEVKRWLAITRSKWEYCYKFSIYSTERSHHVVVTRFHARLIRNNGPEASRGASSRRPWIDIARIGITPVYRSLSNTKRSPRGRTVAISRRGTRDGGGPRDGHFRRQIST